MSLMAMGRVARKNGPLIGAVMAALLIAGTVAGQLSGIGGRGPAGGGTNGANGANPAEKPVATVGDRKITRPELEQFARNLAKQNPMGAAKEPDESEMGHYRLSVITALKGQAALVAVAQKAGINVSPNDLRAERDKQWAAQVRPNIAQKLGLDANADDSKIEAALAKVPNAMPLAALKERVLPDEQVRLTVLKDRLTAQYKTQIPADDAAVRQSLSDMTVRHILVKFGAGALPEAQARVKAEKLLAAVKANPAQMGQLAKENSDDGSKDKGGICEWTPAARTSIVPEFSAALDNLKPGQTYPELVRVADRGYSGFHIIRLEAVKPGKEFPADYDKNKANYTASYLNARVDKRLEAAVEAAAPAVPSTLIAPDLLAEQDIEDAGKAVGKTERNAKLTAALAELAKIPKADDPLGIAPLRRGQILAALDNTPDAIAAYEDALTYRKEPETRIALAALYVKAKQPDKAKAQLTEIENGVIPDPQMEGAIVQLYTQLGDKEKAKAAQDKAKDMQNRQMQAMIQQYQASHPASPSPTVAGTPAPKSVPPGPKTVPPASPPPAAK